LQNEISSAFSSISSDEKFRPCSGTQQKKKGDGVGGGGRGRDDTQFFEVLHVLGWDDLVAKP